MENAILKVLSSPRQAMHLVKKPNSHLIFLSFLVGLISIFDFSARYAVASIVDKNLLIALGFILAIPLGYVLLSVFALFTFLTGKILKGKANFLQIRSALAYSRVPLVVNVMIWIVKLIVYYPLIFTSQFNTSLASGQYHLFLILSFIQLVFLIYAFVLLLHTLGEVQGFSAWMSLLNIILQAILLWICMVVLMSLWFGTSIFIKSFSFINIQLLGVVV